MTDEPEDSDDQLLYAPVDTLRGLLQRGRGLGALRAAEDPETAGALVMDTVRRDWRWDAVDDRQLYLARLIIKLELPLTDVIALLNNGRDEDDCDRAAAVLELLARAGSGEAREALQAYIRQGEHWVDVLERVAGSWPVDWWDDLADIARKRLTGHEPELWRTEPWVRWGLASRAIRRPYPSRATDRDLEASTPQLLSLLGNPCTTQHRKADILRALASRSAAPDLIALVPSLGTADGRWPVPGLSRAVAKLTVLAVPAAREWAVDARPWLSHLGFEVLAGHGETRDLPLLINEFTQQWKARAWCGPKLLAAGLARFGPEAAEAAPVLRCFWSRTPHSYERPFYLTALAFIDPAGLERAYTESLWDCESNARLLGITSAPDLPHVRDRLAALRDDPMEEPEVRTAAGIRLAAAGGRVG